MKTYQTLFLWKHHDEVILMSGQAPDSISQFILVFENFNKERARKKRQSMLSESGIDIMGNVTPAECHVIDYIGKNPLTNAVGISNALEITKGGISKMTSRLMEKGFVESHRIEGNRKEIFFTLTPSGKEVFEINVRMDTQMNERWLALLSEYSPDELDVIKRFLNDFLKII